MLRSFLFIPFLCRLRTCMYQYKPFVFPEGSSPNLKDPTTFETNYTISDIEIEHVLNYTLANDTMWEEVIQFDKPNKIPTPWEQFMMRFGIGEG